MKRRELLRHLQQQGYVLVRAGGDHSIWENPANGCRASLPRHREGKEHTARGISRQLGVPEP